LSPAFTKILLWLFVINLGVALKTDARRPNGLIYFRDRYLGRWLNSAWSGPNPMAGEVNDRRINQRTL
jgi:hypothetical protein